MTNKTDDKRENFTIYLFGDEKEQLARFAQEHRISMNQVVRLALQTYFNLRGIKQ